MTVSTSEETLPVSVNNYLCNRFQHNAWMRKRSAHLFQILASKRADQGGGLRAGTEACVAGEL